MPRTAEVERLVATKLSEWEDIAEDVNSTKFNIFDFFGKENFKEKNRNLIALCSVFGPHYQNDKNENFNVVPEQLQYRQNILGRYPHFFSSWISSLFDVEFSRDETKLLNLIFAQHEQAAKFLAKSYNKPHIFDVNLKVLFELFQKYYPISANQPQAVNTNSNNRQAENNSEHSAPVSEENEQPKYFHIPFLSNLNVIFDDRSVLAHNIFDHSGVFIKQKIIFWQNTNTPNFSTLQHNLKYLKYAEEIDERPPISQEIKNTSGCAGGQETECFGSYFNGKSIFLFIVNILLLFGPAETKNWILLNYTNLKRIDVKSSDDSFHPNFNNIQGPSNRRCFYVVASIATAPYEIAHHICIKPHNGCGLKKANLSI